MLPLARRRGDEHHQAGAVEAMPFILAAAVEADAAVEVGEEVVEIIARTSA
ncbi:hypothetical protein [Streptomyces sp. Mo3]|uniref:hypothetical protein n=1 Tax=Streptomyces sp. Mo3 TaxID=3161190 RepID=UPI0039F0D6D3